MTDIITIQDIINLKGDSVDEFCQYALSKGVTIPNEPYYILSESELNAIDPLIIRSLNKHHKNQQNKDVKTLIGIVKFFDKHKDFGFIVTNGKDIDVNDESGKQHCDFYINSRSCSNYIPNGYEWVTEWVIFDVVKGKAKNVKKLEYNKASLLLAMKYRGVYATIVGRYSHIVNRESFNLSILANIIKHYERGKSNEIFGSFGDYLSTFNEDECNKCILQFSEDKELVNCLFPILYNNTLFMNLESVPYLGKFRTDIIESYINNIDVKDLGKLPDDFDVLPYSEKICRKLIKQPYESLINLLQGIYTKLDFRILDKQDVKTIPLRLALFKITGNNCYITEIQVNWQKVCSFFKNINAYVAYSFYKLIFDNKDEGFVESQPIDGFVYPSTAVQFIKFITEENALNLNAFKNALFKVIIKNNSSECYRLLSELPREVWKDKLDEYGLKETMKYSAFAKLNNYIAKLQKERYSDYSSVSMRYKKKIIDIIKELISEGINDNDVVTNELLEKLPKDDSEKIRVILYKNDCIKNIDADFVIQHIAKFSSDEIQRIVNSDSLNKGKKAEIILSFLKNYNNSMSSFIEKIKEYLYDDEVNNNILAKFSNDDSEKLRVVLYKNCCIKTVDTHFVIQHISKFTPDEIQKIVASESLNELQKAKIVFLFLIRYNDNVSSFIEDLKKYVSDDAINNNILTEFSNEDSVSVKIVLYKNDCVQSVDENFIISYQNKFSISEIKQYLLSEKLKSTQKYKIAVSYMKYLYSTTINHLQRDSYKIYCYEKLVELKKCVKDCCIEEYSIFERDWTASLTEYEKYHLWTNSYEIIEQDYSYYLFDNLLNDDIRSYNTIFNIKRLSKERIVEGLLNNLTKIEKIDNLPTFNKVYYHIYNCIKADINSRATIKNFNNPVFNVLLWFFDVEEAFDFETLRTKFICFNPTDQVRIIKKLFMLAETKVFNLTIDLLESLVRVDRTLFEDIAKDKPNIPVDFSVDVVIKTLSKYRKEYKFFYDKEIYDIIVLNLSLNNGKYKNYDFRLKDFFDKCQGRVYYDRHIWVCEIPYNTGIVNVLNDNFEITLHTGFTDFVHGTNRRGREWWEREYSENEYFEIIKDRIRNLPSRSWNRERSVWIVPITDNSIQDIKEIAKQYNMVIQGNNQQVINELRNIPTEYVYERRVTEQRPGITYCEGRSVSTSWENGYSYHWCANSKCFEHCVVEHSIRDWEKYSMLDFCRILGFNIDATDSHNRFVKYGEYLKFVSIVNRMNYMLEHLKCKSCGELLMPNAIAPYATNIVTRFKCTTPNCPENGNVYYISKCFNWKCYGIIDQRETTRCQNNGWFICKTCGSCCSNRIVEQRITKNNEIGIPTSPMLLDFVERRLGHLEQRKFYCYKCGGLTILEQNRNGDIYKCTNCNVVYERWKYDYNVVN